MGVSHPLTENRAQLPSKAIFNHGGARRSSGGCRSRLEAPLGDQPLRINAGAPNLSATRRLGWTLAAPKMRSTTGCVTLMTRASFGRLFMSEPIYPAMLTSKSTAVDIYGWRNHGARASSPDARHRPRQQ